jgi:hypothetical protein
MSNIRKKFIKQVKKKSKPLVEAALRRGADNIGKRLLDAVNDVNQPSDILFEKLFTAVKSGVLATGQEIMKEKLNRRKAVHTLDNTSNSPKYSTSQKEE